mgnify:CR=1 FL=1
MNRNKKRWGPISQHNLHRFSGVSTSESQKMEPSSDFAPFFSFKTFVGRIVQNLWFSRTCQNESSFCAVGTELFERDQALLFDLYFQNSSKHTLQLKSVDVIIFLNWDIIMLAYLISANRIGWLCRSATSRTVNNCSFPSIFVPFFCPWQSIKRWSGEPVHLEDGWSVL